MEGANRSFRHLRLLFLSILLVCAISVASIYNHTFRVIATNIILEPISFLKEGLHGPVNYIHLFFKDLMDIHKLRAENRRFNLEIAELRRQNTRYKEAFFENKRLRSLLKMKNLIDYNFIVSEVIGYDITPWISRVSINVGTEDGVFPDAIVLAGGGLVGRVLTSSLHYSRVMLITDRNSRVPVIIQRSRARGILEGSGDSECQLLYVEKGADVSIGDTVITSGLGDYFPKGILIGKVIKVDKLGDGTDLFQNIAVRPFVDLYHLEELLILKSSIK